MSFNKKNFDKGSGNIKLSIVLTTLLIISSLAGSGKLYAQSVGDLQSQIDALLATVEQLQEQLASLQGSESSGSKSIEQFIFLKNLRIGDKGSDVEELQARLNSDKKTQIALSGSGSSGNETTYFGPLTKNAVIKFQELYKNEVLSPVGLSRGTGFVGSSTRAKLNSLITMSVSVREPEKSNIEEKVNDGTPFLGVVETVEQAQTLNVFQEYETLALSFPSAYEGLSGDEITLLGIGFERTGNTVHLGSRTLANLSSVSGASIAFTIPDDISKGKHSLFVSNTKGASNKIFFIVTNVLQTKPVIESSTPTEGLYGAEITITGSGFTATGNDIYTSYYIITDVLSPDGTTLKFNIVPFPEIPELQVGVNLGQGIELPIWFYVINDNGRSEEPGKFILKI